MRKPKPREADELFNQIVDAVCWITAERMSLDLDLPQEYCADQIKQLVHEGRFEIDYDKEGDRVRLIPVPSQATNY